MTSVKLPAWVSGSLLLSEPAGPLSVLGLVLVLAGVLGVARTELAQGRRRPGPS